MENNDILTMLTSDDSARITNSIIKTNEETQLIRNIEHEKWKAQEDAKRAARERLDSAYYRHVVECNWHNRVMSLSVIAAVALLVRMMLS